MVIGKREAGGGNRTGGPLPPSRLPLPDSVIAPLAGIVLALAAVKLFLHLVTNVATPYGFHRDEFLYLAMGQHLTLWRMDFPPAIAMLAELTRATLGESLVAVRLVPALAGTAVLVLAGMLARELGGGRFAQALASLSVLASPLFLRSANLFQPVVLDQLCWTLGFYALARLCWSDERSDDLSGRPGWWLVLGVAGGLGLLTKFSVLFFGFALLLGLAVSPQRRALATRWPWVALLIALVIGSPSMVGQLRLGFPVLGQMRDLQSTQLARVSAVDFLGGQLLFGPAVVLAAIGLLHLLLTEAARPYRVIGWTCAAAFLTLLLLGGKPYYAGPLYPVLFAAAATVLEAWPAGPSRRPSFAVLSRAGSPRRLLRAAVVLLVLIYGLATLPFGIPILPPPEMARYAAATGLETAVTTNTGEVARLPQDYADMLGWEAQVAAVARVYNGLTPGQRAQAVIVADNYGEAGALDLFGPRHGLPPAVSAAGSYWFFGPGDKRGDVVVSVGVPGESLRRFFRTVTLAARVTHPWAVAEEADVPIHVCESPYRSLQAAWPSLAGQN